MRTVDQIVDELDKRYRLYSRERDFISNALRSFGAEVREEAAKKCEQTTKVMTRKAFQIADEIRSIEIK